MYSTCAVYYIFIYLWLSIIYTRTHTLECIVHVQCTIFMAHMYMYMYMYILSFMASDYAISSILAVLPNSCFVKL